MSTSDDILTAVVQLIESSPQAGQSLLLYGLVSTLATERGGHLYMLGKLRDMREDTRRLAYGLMELLARGQAQGPTWDSAVARMESAVRGA